MLTAERHRAILRLLDERGRITVAEIAAHFEISAATARRDAVLLTEAGKAARSHGGLLPAAFFRQPAVPAEPPARSRSPAVRIAARAADLLPHAGNVFIDASPIAFEVGRLLIARGDLRIYTNSIPLIGLAPESQATLTGIGGETQKGSRSTAGNLARSWVAHLRFDAALIGAAGLEMEGGAYARDAAQAAVQTEAMRRTAVRILVAEAATWNRPTPARIAPWSAFTSFVTNLDLADDRRAFLSAGRLQLYFV